MATEGEEAAPRVAWYRKFFEYWKNRNRIGPGKVELSECDFFIVGPRRTLRILRPNLKSGRYYENTSERPESINDNFFTRWSRRPHSSGNCRCSFRHSRRLSTTEEQIISAELNRIRTSLCEAEQNERAIEELEQKVSVNLQKLHVPLPEVEQPEADEKAVLTTRVDGVGDNEHRTEERTIKSKIVKDLEKYINVLLEEILDDTVKCIEATEDASTKDARVTEKKGSPVSQRSAREERNSDKEMPEADRSSSNDGSFDISFSFHMENTGDKKGKEDEGKDRVSVNDGYVNRGFIGATNDPDSLDFYLQRSAGMEVTLEQLDCIDSGINSVETIEFQPDQEPSLEQSLLQIIDEKLGRTPLRNSWEDLSTGGQENDRQGQPTKGTDERKVIPRSGQHLSNDDAATERSEVNGKNDAERRSSNGGGGEPRESAVRTAGGIDISMDNLAREEEPTAVELKELEEAVNEPSFEKLRLEFEGSSTAKEPSSLGAKKRKGMTRLRKKFCPSLDEGDKVPPPGKSGWNEKMGSFVPKKEGGRAIELEDYRKKWPDIEETTSASTYDPREFVTFRKNRKPMIVFLHGFGSSAEIFEHQLQYFSALGYPCIAPEMLGHGMSSAPGRSRDYHFNKLLKDLDAVLCHYAFRPGQKCVLVAHNYGCSLAAALACKYDSSIHQLVLISGGGPTPLAAPSTESTGHCCLRAILAPFLMCGLHRDILYSARGRQHPYCGSEPPEQWPSHMKYILDGMVWPEGDYVYHRRICTPTLLVHGLRDNKVSLVQECQMERTMMKAFLEAIPAAGHTPMTDCPEQLNHMIHCFIDLWKSKKW